jgi:hypothetical protein
MLFKRRKKTQYIFVTIILVYCFIHKRGVIFVVKYSVIIMLIFFILLSCATLPEKYNEYSSLAIIKVSINKTAFNILFTATSVGDASYGFGINIYTGEIDTLYFKNLTTGKLVRPDYFKDGFCFLANIPAGIYYLETAVLDEYREIRFFENDNSRFNVEENKVNYFGAYTIDVSYGKEPRLKKVSEEEEKENREKISRIINTHHKKKGWIFE